MSDIIAIVPARKEIRKLNNKNTLPFGDSNLLIHKIRQLKTLDEIDGILVSSEDSEILKMAENEGVEINKRPEKYSIVGSSFGEFVEYVCGEVNAKHILWTSVTAPFVSPEIYRDAIKTYFDVMSREYDSLITVQLHQRYILDHNGALNYSRGLRHKESEFLPHLYLYTNGIQLAPREKMIEWKYTWGHIPYMYEVDKKVGIDIIDEFDYNIANLLWRQKEDENR